MKILINLLIAVIIFQGLGSTENKEHEGFDIKEHYNKYEYNIPMRDGVNLFTAVYMPIGTPNMPPTKTADSVSCNV